MDEIYATLCCSTFPEYDTLAYYKKTLKMDKICATLWCSSFPEYDTLAYYKMTLKMIGSLSNGYFENFEPNEIVIYGN
jgi:hypothetical protein